MVAAGTLEQPAEPWLGGVGVNTPSAGVAVTERTAAGLPVVFACDLIIKQDVGKTSTLVKKRNPDGTSAVDRDSPVYRTLHDAPNRVMTPYEFKETMQGYLNFWGNAFAEIVRTPVSTNVTPRSKYTAIELWPLDASRMTVKINASNQLQYTYELPDAGKPKTWIYDPAEPPVLHLRQNSRDGIVGRSRLTMLREAMGTAIAADRFVGRVYGQGGHPRVALSTDQKLSPEAARRIRNDFETMTVGEHNWHRVVVMDHNLKPVPLVMPNRDAQFVELMQLSRDQLCGTFRVPPHKVANLDRSTNNNIEHQALEYVGDCLMPHFVCWQQAIARDLLNPIAIGSHFAQFDIKELIRGDFKTLTDALHLMRNDGVITANEWRREAGWDDRIDDPAGDLLLANTNMAPIGTDPAATIQVDFPTPGSGAMN